MKLNWNTGTILVMAALVAVNMTFFIKGIKLSEDINYYENELATLQEHNIDTEQQIYKLESYTRTASLAAELEFGKFHDPIYSETPQYAFNR